MGNLYKYQRGGEVYGPVSAKEIRKLVAAGKIGPDDLICPASGEGRWLPIRKVKNLRFDAIKIDGPGLAKPLPGIFVDSSPTIQSPPTQLAEIAPRDEPEVSVGMSTQTVRRTAVGIDWFTLSGDCAIAMLYGTLWFVLAWPVGFFGRMIVFKILGL